MRAVPDQCQSSGAEGNSCASGPGGVAFLSTSRRSSLTRGSRQRSPSVWLRSLARALAWLRSSSRGRPVQPLPFHCMPSAQRIQARRARWSMTSLPSLERLSPGAGSEAAVAAGTGGLALFAVAAPTALAPSRDKAMAATPRLRGSATSGNGISWVSMPQWFSAWPVPAALPSATCRPRSAGFEARFSGAQMEWCSRIRRTAHSCHRPAP